MSSEYQLLSREDVGRLFSVSKYTIDNWRKQDPDFPQPVVALGGDGKTIRWRESDIHSYMDKRIARGM